MPFPAVGNGKIALPFTERGKNRKKNKFIKETWGGNEETLITIYKKIKYLSSGVTGF